MCRVCQKTKPSLQIGLCCFVTHDVEMEGSRSVHYRGLKKVVLLSRAATSIKPEKYLEQDRAFLGGGHRIHDESKDDGLYRRLNQYRLHNRRSCDCNGTWRKVLV